MAVYEALMFALGFASLCVTAILGIISIIIMLSNRKK